MSDQRFTQLSRRRLLQLSLATAVTVPLGAGAVQPAAGAAPPDLDEVYRAAFQAALGKNPEVRVFGERGRQFLYRPRQLLVADQDVQRVARRLADMGLSFEISAKFAGVVKLVFTTELDVPKLVTTLRDPRGWPQQQPPVVQPHHVTVGHVDNIMGNPVGPPAAAASPGWPPAAPAADGAGVLVGVCDTGIGADADAMHADWLGGYYAPDPQDVDPLYVVGDQLGLESGHGTFVCGVLRRAAPGARFDPSIALDDAGLGDEESLVAAIARLDPGVSIINLSLGYFTQDDVEPAPLRRTVDQLGPAVAIVASAGNSATSRPSWPAALPEVLAVAAVTRDPRSGQVLPAPYSNFGTWVDACAEGARVSTYVKGQMPLGGVPIPFGGFAEWQGTSFAAPHVAGRLAAIMTTYGYDARQACGYLASQATWRPGYGVFVA